MVSVSIIIGAPERFSQISGPSFLRSLIFLLFHWNRLRETRDICADEHCLLQICLIFLLNQKIAGYPLREPLLAFQIAVYI